MSQGFVYAYQTALERALAESSNPRWKPMIPQVFARLLHYHGTDAKLRSFRHERWIPAKWTNLHQLYARAIELGVARIAVALPSAGPGAMQWSTEQEYVYALLIQQLNMGSLSPSEIDWASAQMRAWGRKLEFEAVPQIVGRLLRRSREQARPRAPHRQRVRPDAAFSRHDAARRPARARDARAAPDRYRRARRGGRGQPATDRDPGEGASRRRAQPPRGSAALAAHARDGRRQGARGPRPHLRRADAARDRRARQRRRCRQRADRSVRRRRQPAHAASPRAGRARFARGLHRAGRRSGVAGQGPQRRRVCASRRRAASARASCSGRSSRFASPTPSNGCWAPCAASTRFRTTKSRRACRSSPIASCRSPSTPGAPPRKTSAWW